MTALVLTLLAADPVVETPHPGRPIAIVLATAGVSAAAFGFSFGWSFRTDDTLSRSAQVQSDALALRSQAATDGRVANCLFALAGALAIGALLALLLG